MTTIFGTVFNNISIQRKDSNNNVVDTIKVPISYSAKQKFLTLLEQKQKEVALTLPRMSFQFVAINYNNEEKLKTVGKIHKTNNDANGIDYVYNPTPYNIDFELVIYVKHTEDGVQILEQILPFFTPSFNVSINEIPEMGIKKDVPIFFRSLTVDDSFEGDMLTRRALVYSLLFEMRGYLYGPVNESGLIKEVVVDMYGDISASSPTTQYNAFIDPFTANADDNYNISEIWDEDFSQHITDEFLNHLVDENGNHIIGELP